MSTGATKASRGKGGLRPREGGPQDPPSHLLSLRVAADWHRQHYTVHDRTEERLRVLEEQRESAGGLFVVDGLFEGGTEQRTVRDALAVARGLLSNAANADDADVRLRETVRAKVALRQAVDGARTGGSRALRHAVVAVRECTENVRAEEVRAATLLALVAGIDLILKSDHDDGLVAEVCSCLLASGLDYMGAAPDEPVISGFEAKLGYGESATAG